MAEGAAATINAPAIEPTTPTTAAPDPGVAAGTPAPPTTPVTPVDTPPPSWTEGMAADVRGYVETKGFKDPTAVVQSYQNLEKLIGAPRERLLTLPEKADDPSWAQVHERLGKPAKAEDYKINMPEGADTGFADWAKNTFHEVNLTSAQAESLSTKWNDYAAQVTKDHNETVQHELDQQENALRTEWGLAYDKNINVARRAAHEIGLEETQINSLESSLGFDGFMKMLHNIGSKFGGEGAFETGSGPSGFSGAMTPAQAKAEIQALRQDSDFVKEYADGKHSARERMDRLHAMAYPPEAKDKVMQ